MGPLPLWVSISWRRVDIVISTTTASETPRLSLPSLRLQSNLLLVSMSRVHRGREAASCMCSSCLAWRKKSTGLRDLPPGNPFWDLGVRRAQEYIRDTCAAWKRTMVHGKGLPEKAKRFTRIAHKVSLQEVTANLKLQCQLERISEAWKRGRATIHHVEPLELTLVHLV